MFENLEPAGPATNFTNREVALQQVWRGAAGIICVNESLILCIFISDARSLGKWDVGQPPNQGCKPERAEIFLTWERE